MNAQSSVLQIDNVSAAYDARPVIQDISFDVRAGEMFGLIGLNGAGKTTLIKSIVSLRDQQSGTIQIFGEKPGHKASRRNVAFLPERFEPPWFLSGLEFLQMSLKIYRQKFDRSKILEFAESLALDTKALDRRVQTYSKGMRQKLGLMGTILTGCRLMILDEPMSGLDPLARTLVKDALLKARNQGQTIFLSSHILADMEEICDRVAVLHDARIQFIGEPKKLIAETNSGNLERAFLHFVEKKQAA
jgi:ABC-2 type transport system ATP-binding protein